MDKKICPDCGTENEKEYIYCKNCGTPLKSKPSAEEKPQATQFVSSDAVNGEQPKAERQAPPPYGSPYMPYGYTDYTVDGIPADEVMTFVGKKAADICPKFMRMELTKSKVSWCWPAAVLGFLFGPMGAALWFLYRKMYKIGGILLGIGAAFTAIFAVINYGDNSQSLKSIFEAITNGTVSLNGILDDAASETTVLSVITSAAENLISLVTGILSGIFGFYAYKEHCIKTIFAFRNTCADMLYYRIGLHSIGGVSGGALAAGIVSIIILNNAVSIITTILALT